MLQMILTILIILTQKLLVKVEVLESGGDFEEKITVEANTSGVSTAFTPTGNATLFMSNKVSVISPNSTANSVVQHSTSSNYR